MHFYIICITSEVKSKQTVWKHYFHYSTYFTKEIKVNLKRKIHLKTYTLILQQDQLSVDGMKVTALF
jgi:hypothetical protein